MWFCIVLRSSGLPVVSDADGWMHDQSLRRIETPFRPMLKPVWNLRQWSFKSGIRFFDTKLENSNVFTKGILYTVCFGKFVVAWNRLVPLMPSQTIFQVSALSKLRKKAPKRVQILCNRQKEPHWEQENIFSLGFVFFEKFDSTSCCWPILDTRSDLGKQKKNEVFELGGLHFLFQRTVQNEHFSVSVSVQV